MIEVADVGRLPRHLSRHISSLHRLEPSRQGLAGVLDIAEALRDESTSGPDGRTVVSAAKASLSGAAAKCIAEMPFKDFVASGHRVADTLASGALQQAPVLQVMRMQMHQAAAHIRNGDAPRCRYLDEFEELLTDFAVFRSCAMWTLLADAAAPGVARQAFDLVRMAGMENLASALDSVLPLLVPWPTASSELVSALRAWVPARLRRLAVGWVGRDSVATSSSHDHEQLAASGEQPPAAGAAPTEDEAALPVSWWLRTLRAASLHGLMERLQLAEVCGVLEPRLVQEGIRTPAKKLACALVDCPASIQYLAPGASGHAPQIVIDTPLQAGRRRSQSRHRSRGKAKNNGGSAP